jgi:uncharacterized repeat protein (TIGR01451 family)
VNVALNAGSLLSNQVTVSGGGSATASADDVTGIGGPQNFSLSMSPGSESVAAGVKGSYFVAMNGINAFSGRVSFGVSGLPSGVTASFSPATLTGTGSTTLMFTTTAATPKGTFTLTVTGTSGMLSQSASALLTITESRAALSIVKTHTLNFIQGQQNASYLVSVFNAANATPTSGTVTVTEILPPGLTLHAMFGTGWSCVSNTCSRSDVLGTGMEYGLITVFVNVASNATSPQVNQVSVSGGGSATASTSDSTLIDDFASRPQPHLGVFQGGIWLVDMDGNGQVSGGEIFGWGAATDTPVLGDWNRSGTTKAGVFRNGLWFLDLNGNHQLASSSIIGWGQPGDIPVVGDWIQSGPQIGVFRNGIWFLDLFGNHQLTDQRQIVGWGQAGDVPVVGDWNGQGATKIGVFRKGLWYLDTDGTHELNSSKVIGWGQAGDIPVVGDWNGDGRTKIGVFRKGYWFLDVAGDHQLVQRDIVGWGQPNDIPVVGDWDNSGTTKIGVYSSGTWFLDISGNHQLTSPTQILSWGKAGDKPEPGRW